jgi:hypothetical protein
MARYAGLHTLPGFTRAALAKATPELEKFSEPLFVRALTGFADGKVVCEWDATDKEAVAKAYAEIGFPYDEIVMIEAICENQSGRVDTKYV